ncbi:hypothetical protein C791_7942 [Amycolatopsis azurea DSM 43854]|uniref:Uncharacterized protein n=1 Tax=Amycolatopsis azurea DSM 43854 TaxID=1238180 RepID=M2QA73_9PSEU|nr:hypothetical protein C791_7942 [Amycolatopsis azurea DSM 43854]
MVVKRSATPASPECACSALRGRPGSPTLSRKLESVKKRPRGG